jgi:hypothetical protein
MLVRKYLDRYGIRVGQWYPHYVDDNGKVTNITYQACYETHRVFIPIPVDDYALYVCLHEIGHLVTGEARYSYLQEYRAEQWALKKLKYYGYYQKNFEREAQQYVLNVMYEDICFRGLRIAGVNPKIQAWIKRDVERIRRGAIRWVNRWRRQEVDYLGRGCEDTLLTVEPGGEVSVMLAAS